MNTLVLRRDGLCYDDVDGVFGSLEGPGLSLATVEPPWRGNQRDVSCIPPGAYELVPHVGVKYQNVARLEGVPGRGAVLIHAGNWAGEAEKGRRCESEGCILVGRERALIHGQRGVTSSRDSLAAVMAWLDARWARGEIVWLEIRAGDQPPAAGD